MSLAKQIILHGLSVPFKPVYIDQSSGSEFTCTFILDTSNLSAEKKQKYIKELEFYANKIDMGIVTEGSEVFLINLLTEGGHPTEHANLTTQELKERLQ